MLGVDKSSLLMAGELESICRKLLVFMCTGVLRAAGVGQLISGLTRFIPLRFRSSLGSPRPARPLCFLRPVCSLVPDTQTFLFLLGAVFAATWTLVAPMQLPGIP